jgi:DNA processing protein
VSEILGPHHADYPVHLRTIPSPPDPLHVAGRLCPEDGLAVAVVGSRYPTGYGVDVATRLAADLARRGVTIVSGLARGIDIAAHRGALGVGGRTIAVLGSGLDVIYPAEHEPEARAIAGQGAVVSPFQASTPPLPHHFPARNRVIAGLSLAVVVVEASARSGSLITAGLAADLGREVMAVPGRVTSDVSRGTHRLLKEGAALVEGWEDVVAGLPVPWRDAVRRVPAGPPTATGSEGEAGTTDQLASPERARVLVVMGEDPLGIDDVIEATGIAPGRVAALLAALEIDGMVRQLPGKRFVRATPVPAR